MKKKAICFSRKGMEVIKKLNRICMERGMEPADAFVCMRSADRADNADSIDVEDRADTADSIDVEDRADSAVSIGDADSVDSAASTDNTDSADTIGSADNVGNADNIEGAESAENADSIDSTASGDKQEVFVRVAQPLSVWTKSQLLPGNALLFVGAAGIAVRALSGLAADKLSDSPVIVIDDNARYVIPILSGHAGGANKLACVLADLLGALPVITTSTDLNNTFSVDTFAVENRLKIVQKEGIKKVSAKALEGKCITLSIQDYPPKERVDVIVADETDAEYSLLLKPRRFTVGLGMKKGKGREELEQFFLKTLSGAGIGTDDIYALCTIDRKKHEPALTALRDKYRIPILAFDSALLGKAQGEFTASEYVRETTGVDNVCERAAVMGAGGRAELVLKKQARDGMTMAIARRETVMLPAFF